VETTVAVDSVQAGTARATDEAMERTPAGVKVGTTKSTAEVGAEGEDDEGEGDTWDDLGFETPSERRRLGSRSFTMKGLRGSIQ
jgi:hypothetical protein